MRDADAENEICGTQELLGGFLDLVVAVLRRVNNSQLVSWSCGWFGFRDCWGSDGSSGCS